MASINYEKTTYRREAMKAAEELGYGRDVVEKIKAAKNDGEIERIMINARHEKFNMDERF